jgi:hypothetical protein
MFSDDAQPLCTISVSTTENHTKNLFAVADTPGEAACKRWIANARTTFAVARAATRHSREQTRLRSLRVQDGSMPMWDRLRLILYGRRE